jgi:hypothetical protein
MHRLGYNRYVAQGADSGSVIADRMAEQAPPGLLGIHVNMPAIVPADIAKALLLLGEQRQQLQRRGHLHPGGGHRLPRRDLPGAPELDGAGVPQADLLQQGPTRAATSPPGNSLISSPGNCGRRSDRGVEAERIRNRRGVRYPQRLTASHPGQFRDLIGA